MQLLLGTLLGDGWMEFNRCRHGKFCITHSAKQAGYCRHKAEVLADYVRTLPHIVTNYGWGHQNCVFTTVTSSAFEFLRGLCYQRDPKTGRYKRRITKKWLKRLTRRALAYWFMDDGSSTHCMVILNTHRYTKKEVELLAEMLKEKGVPAVVMETGKRGSDRKYWVLRLRIAAARAFVKMIRPHMHPSMLYKLKVTEAVEIRCTFCPRRFPAKPSQLRAKNPTCGRRECKLAGNRLRNEQYLTPNKRAERNSKTRQRYHADLEKSRTEGRERATKRRQDPAKRAEMSARKRAWRKRKKGDSEYEIRLKEERQRYNAKLMKDPVRRERKNERNRRRRQNMTQEQKDEVNAQQRARREKRKQIRSDD